MSAALLEESYEDNVYGAVSFRVADSTAEAFDYTLHVRFGACQVVAVPRVGPIYAAVTRLICKYVVHPI